MAQTKVLAYLKIDAPDCNGESSAEKDHFDVFAWSQEITYNGTIWWTPGGTREVKCAPVTCLIPLDKAAAKLMENAAKLVPVKTFTLKLYRDNPKDGKREHYFSFMGEDCRFAEVSLHTESSDSLPFHAVRVGLVAKIYKWEHTKAGVKGQVDLSKVTLE